MEDRVKLKSLLETAKVLVVFVESDKTDSKVLALAIHSYVIRHYVES